MQKLLHMRSMRVRNVQLLQMRNLHMRKITDELSVKAAPRETGALFSTPPIQKKTIFGLRHNSCTYKHILLMTRLKQILMLCGLVLFAALFGLIKTMKQQERQERIVLATERYTIRTAPAVRDIPYTSIPMLGKVIPKNSTNTVSEIEFQIQEHQLSQIQEDQTGIINPSSLTGTVTAIDSTLDPDTHTATIRMSVSDPEGLLRPNLLVSTIIQIPEETPVLLIPTSALILKGKRASVYIKIEDDLFEARVVKLGARIENWVVIESGLTAGEDVVINGVFLVDASMQANEE